MNDVAINNYDNCQLGEVIPCSSLLPILNNVENDGHECIWLKTVKYLRVIIEKIGFEDEQICPCTMYKGAQLKIWNG